MITKTDFGPISNGQMVHKYAISNRKGECAEFLDYGASVHCLWLLDRNGSISDCVLGVTTSEELEQMNNEGSVIGRCANRIAYGRCKIGRKEVQLETNQQGHFLHGGSGNYAKKMFAAEADPEHNQITFSLADTGEGGFHNNVQVKVTYTFDDDSCLTIDYEMIPEEETILCPTNHAYFNLDGFGDVRDEKLTIQSSAIADTDEEGLPDGRTFSVGGNVYDFTSPRTLREAIESDREANLKKRSRGTFDTVYLIDGSGYREAATLFSEQSGRELTVYTDSDALILFLPDHCSRKKGKRGVQLPDYAAGCLETQFVPNAVNCPGFRSPVFKAGEVLRTRTQYAFRVKKDFGGANIGESDQENRR
ncbi:MAG: aldose epimerase family protein [Faecousia sp.]